MATIALYAHSLTGGYVFEDTRTVVALGVGSRWLSRLLAGATQAVSMAPIAARSVSLALHLLCGGLLWRLARPVIGPAAALFGLALCLWHPLNTEAVAYAANQAELLVAAFTLAALLAADRTVVGAWLLCASAVLAKEPGIAAFLLVPAVCVARGTWGWRRVCWWLGCSALPALACWPMVASHGYGAPDPHVIAMNLAAYGWLVTKFAFPIGLTVMPDWWTLTVPWMALLLAGWMAVFALGAWKPAITVGASIVLLSALPRLLWHLPGGLHEHHTYLACGLLSMGVAARLFPTPRTT